MSHQTDQIFVSKIYLVKILNTWCHL